MTTWPAAGGATCSRAAAGATCWAAAAEPTGSTAAPGGTISPAGAGRDVFVFSSAAGVDRITDWQGRRDAIDLTAIDGGGADPRLFERADGDVMLFYGDLKVRIEDAGLGAFDDGSFLL